MPIDLRPLKSTLRAEIMATRNALAAEEIDQRSTAIVRTITALPIFAGAETISCYHAFGSEVRTEELLRHALAAGKHVALPRIVPRERRLTLHLIMELEQLVAGPFDLREPAPDAPEIHPADVELFVVPGSVFDAAGNRIGYGAGYYDSLLVESEGWRVAPCYLFQLTAHVPAAEHDMPMDLIVTEAGVVDCLRGQMAGDHLRLRNMIFYGHHGAFPHEQEQGIRLAVDVDMRLDLQAAGITDHLATSVNYPLVYRLIQRIQSERAFTLFEALADHIATAILREFASVVEATVTARKFNPPIGGLMDAFEVVVTRSRSVWMRRGR